MTFEEELSKVMKESAQLENYKPVDKVFQIKHEFGSDG
jgi:hypothetical protein